MTDKENKDKHSVNDLRHDSENGIP